MGMTPEDWKRRMLKAIKAREPMLEDAQQKLRNAEDDAVMRRPVGVSTQEMLDQDDDVQRARERVAHLAAEEQAQRDAAAAAIAQYEREKAAIESALAGAESDFATARSVSDDPGALDASKALVQRHIDASDFADARAAFKALQGAIAAARRAGVERQHAANKDAERAVFEAAIPDLENFDTYETILAESPERLDELNTAFDSMLARANEMAAAGASLDQQKAMLSHIPENFWPDRFFTELEAWRVTEAAFLEEAVGKLFEPKEEEESELGEKIEKVKDLGEAVAKVKPDEDAKEAFMAETRERLATAGEDVALAAELGGIVAGFATDGKKERTEGEKVKVGLERAKAISSVTTGILDQVAEHLENVEQLQAVKAVMDIINGVNGPMIDMANSFIDAGEAQEREADSSKNVQERLEAQQKYEEALWSAVSAAAATGVSVTKILLPLAGEMGKQVTPILGVPGNAIAVVKSVKDVIEKGALRSQTSDLADEAATVDPRYTNMIQQELSSLNKGIAKSAVNAVGNTVEAAGAVTTVAGAAPAGLVISIVGKVITYGGKAVFMVVDTAQARECEDLLERARAGDRQARQDIFANSGRYAKMFIAIGATKSPPDAIAMKFVTQRGLTETDLADSATSTMVVRTYLLTKSGEQDDHRTVLDSISEAASAVGKKISDTVQGIDRSIPYGEEEQKWTYAAPVKFTGAWWLKTETDAVKNGLDSDTVTGLQGAFSTYESSLTIAKQTDDAARWTDHFEAASDLYDRARRCSPTTHTGTSHIAMEACRVEIAATLGRRLAELQDKIDPEAAEAREEAARAMCGEMLLEAKSLMQELDLVDEWRGEIDAASVLAMEEKDDEAITALGPVLGALRFARKTREAAARG